MSADFMETRGGKDMKKSLFFLLVFLGAFFVITSICGAVTYNIKQLTYNDYHDQDPQINSNGWIVWVGSDGLNDEIFLYDGSSTIQLTNNAYDDQDPQINSNGWIVWAGSDGLDDEIFLYDGSSTIQLTNDTYEDMEPKINNGGWIVWTQFDSTDTEIYLYDGAGITQITNDALFDSNPGINDSGWVVWMRYGTDAEIYLYDGAGITQLTNNTYEDQEPQINANGHIVWKAGGGSPYGGIDFYDGSGTTRLTGNLLNYGPPQISDGGHIVWEHDSGYSEIFFASPVTADTAAFSATPIRGAAPLTVSFTSLSYGDVDTWSWDLDNDGVEDSTEQNPVHTYDLQGLYTASLTVSWAGGSDTEIKVDYIIVSEPRRVIDKLRHKICEPGDAVRIIGSGFGDGAPGDILHIGPKELPYGHKRIRLWTDSKIKIRIPKRKYFKNGCAWFKGGDSRKVKIWITVDGADTNTKRLELLKNPLECQ
jgi:PKD repeat protein